MVGENLVYDVQQVGDRACAQAIAPNAGKLPGCARMPGLQHLAAGPADQHLAAKHLHARELKISEVIFGPALGEIA